jgi:hypothetical protein
MADPVLKARAAALFRELVAQAHRDALAEDKARVERERAKRRNRRSPGRTGKA